MAHIINNPMSVPSNTITLHTTGTYADQDVEINNSVTLGSLTNAPTGEQTYTEDTTANTVLPAGGYLYINKGWHDNTKISLGHLIPEIADHDAGDSHILFGYKAYDEKGNVITGTMATVDPTFAGGGVTATAGGSVTTAPKVTVTQSISSTNVVIEFKTETGAIGYAIDYGTHLDVYVTDDSTITISNANVTLIATGIYKGLEFNKTEDVTLGNTVNLKADTLYRIEYSSSGKIESTTWDYIGG
jgi:hypothetical protein